MSVKITWDNSSQSTLYVSLERDWTWQDFMSAFHESHEMMNTAKHPVSLIIDVSETQHIPPGFFSFMRRIRLHAHPLTGAIILVGANKVITYITNSFVGIFGKSGRPFYMAETVQEARWWLADVVPQRQWQLR